MRQRPVFPLLLRSGAGCGAPERRHCCGLVPARSQRML